MARGTASPLANRLAPGDRLEIGSAMSQSGAVFSDGVKEDFLPFDSGAIATVTMAERRGHLVAG